MRAGDVGKNDLAAADPISVSTKPGSALPKPKPKKGNVRFATTTEGEVVPERFKFERNSTPRSKAQEALTCLLAGNERFRKGTLERCKAGPEILDEINAEGAKPSTVILACSDSRVPPEIVMDQGLADCHVVRVAGNVVNDFVMGSILFAVQHLGCRLVLVLGHSKCSVVASGVQAWARSKSLKEENPTARTLAESVQETLGQGRGGEADPPGPHGILASPFASQPVQRDSEPKPGLLARLCRPCSRPTPTHEDEYDSSSPPAAKASNASGSEDSRRSPSHDRGSGRHGIARSSVNPLAALVGAIGGAVEAVVSSGQHDAGFKSLVHKENRLRDKGWDSDDEDLKKGLTKQDSLEFTRARLAKQRAERKIETLRQMAVRSDVNSVIDENIKVSASTILRGLVKNVSPEIVRDMEVAAAKYDLEDGSVKILSHNWYSNRTYYNSSD